jgi:hypothetical protein
MEKFTLPDENVALAITFLDARISSIMQSVPQKYEIKPGKDMAVGMYKGFIEIQIPTEKLLETDKTIDVKVPIELLYRNLNEQQTKIIKRSLSLKLMGIKPNPTPAALTLKEDELLQKLKDDLSTQDGQTISDIRTQYNNTQDQEVKINLVKKVINGLGIPKIKVVFLLFQSI